MLVSLLARCLFNLHDNTGVFTAILIFIILFIYWLCGVFIAAYRLSLVAASGDHSLVANVWASHCVASLTVKRRS